MPTIDTPAGDFEVTGVAFPDDPANAEVIDRFDDLDEFEDFDGYEQGLHGYGYSDPFNSLDGWV